MKENIPQVWYHFWGPYKNAALLDAYRQYPKSTPPAYIELEYFRWQLEQGMTYVNVPSACGFERVNHPPVEGIQNLLKEAKSKVVEATRKVKTLEEKVKTLKGELLLSQENESNLIKEKE